MLDCPSVYCSILKWWFDCFFLYLVCAFRAKETFFYSNCLTVCLIERHCWHYTETFDISANVRIRLKCKYYPPILAECFYLLISFWCRFLKFVFNFKRKTDTKYDFAIATAVVLLKLSLDGALLLISSATSLFHFSRSCGSCICSLMLQIDKFNYCLEIDCCFVKGENSV